MSNLVFLTSYTLPLWVAIGLFFGPEFLWMTVANLFILHPIFDFLIEKFVPNNKNAFIEGKLSQTFPKSILLLYPLVQFTLVAIALHRISELETFNFEYLSLVIATGAMTGGAGLTMAHELMHGKSNLAKASSLALMWMTSYSHWFIEHVLGHHKNVGKLEDPATSRKNESLYAFIPRSIIGQIKSSYIIKAEQFIKLWSVQFIIYAAIFLALGPSALVFFILQSIVGILLLEQVNYIEHYGLEREKVNGQYLKVTAKHSWDCYSFLTNVSMFNLGFHADHHANINKEYTKLVSHEESNKMPFGFTIQMLMAMVPSIWFKKMNPILEQKSDAKKYFTPNLITELKTNTISQKYNELTDDIIIQHLYRYLKFTKILEVEVINNLLEEILDDGISHELLQDMSLSQSMIMLKKAKQIKMEEDEHADSVISILNDVKNKTNIKDITLDRPKTLETLLDELSQIQNKRIRSLTLFSFVFVSETLISNKLSVLAKDKELYEPISSFMLDHLKDEVKHSHFFGEFLIDLLPSLTRKEQRYVLSKIEDYKALFLTADIKSINHELTCLGVSKIDCKEVISEIEDQYLDINFNKECEATNRYIKLACRSAHFVQLQVIS